MRLGTSIPTLKVGSTAVAAIKRGSNRVYDADVAAFQQASEAADVTGILDLVDYLKAESLWDYARFYPMKSSQNAGTGSTVYGLGGLTSNNMTLVNSPTWGSDGVTFDGSTQYGNVGDIFGGGNFFTAIRASLVTTPVSQEHFWGYYNGVANQREVLAGFVGLKMAAACSSDGQGATGFGLQTIDDQAALSDVVRAYSFGANGSLGFFLNKTSLGSATWFGTQQSSLFSSVNDVYFCAQNTGSGPTYHVNAQCIAAIVIEGSPSPLTTTQRETITDLINAL